LLTSWCELLWSRALYTRITYLLMTTDKRIYRYIRFFKVYLRTLYATWRRMIRWSANYELEPMWKEAVTAEFEVLSLQSFDVSEEKKLIRYSRFVGEDSNPGSPKCDAVMQTIWPRPSFFLIEIFIWLETIQTTLPGLRVYQISPPPKKKRTMNLEVRYELTSLHYFSTHSTSRTEWMRIVNQCTTPWQQDQARLLISYPLHSKLEYIIWILHNQFSFDDSHIDTWLTE
jgi:hypothetical protein